MSTAPTMDLFQEFFCFGRVGPKMICVLSEVLRCEVLEDNCLGNIEWSNGLALDELIWRGRSDEAPSEAFKVGVLAPLVV